MLHAVLATANPDKAAEITALLSGSLVLLPRPRWLPDTVEDGDTVEANAYLKAVSVAKATGLPAIADDTVLEVDVLGGAPGLRSARYAGEGAGYAENTAKLLRDLAGVPAARRGARVRTVALFSYPDGRRVVGEGVALGTVTKRPRGTTGFGYDAVFVPAEGDGRTLAEMSAAEKALLFCRGRAFRDLVARLKAATGPCQSALRSAGTRQYSSRRAGSP